MLMQRRNMMGSGMLQLLNWWSCEDAPSASNPMVWVDRIRGETFTKVKPFGWKPPTDFYVNGYYTINEDLQQLNEFVRTTLEGNSLHFKIVIDCEIRNDSYAAFLQYGVAEKGNLQGATVRFNRRSQYNGAFTIYEGNFANLLYRQDDYLRTDRYNRILFSYEQKANGDIIVCVNDDRFYQHISQPDVFIIVPNLWFDTENSGINLRLYDIKYYEEK